MNPTWFAQETETSCVAACVRMVLSSLGKTWTEEKLRELLGNPILGLTLTAAQKRLSEFSAKVEIDQELNLDDLRDFTRQNIFR